VFDVVVGIAVVVLVVTNDDNVVVVGVAVDVVAELKHSIPLLVVSFAQTLHSACPVILVNSFFSIEQLKQEELPVLLL
jgi:hypothetical protein